MYHVITSAPYRHKWITQLNRDNEQINLIDCPIYYPGVNRNLRLTLREVIIVASA